MCQTTSYLKPSKLPPSPPPRGVPVAFSLYVCGRSFSQGGICVNLTPKMRQSSLNVTPRLQVMPNFTFPLHEYDSKKRLNRQQVLLRLAPTLVKVNDLTPLRQEFSYSAPKIFGVEYTDSNLVIFH